MNTTTKPGVLAVMDAPVSDAEQWERATGWHSDYQYTDSPKVAQTWKDSGREVRPVCAAADSVQMDKARATVERLAEAMDALLAQRDMLTGPEYSADWINARAALADFRGEA